jgi:cytochrome c oxidase cbb3-type subunit III
MHPARCGLVLLLAAGPLPAQSAVTPFMEAKARSILRDRLPCLGCHELDGEGGRSAPSLTGVGERRTAAYIEAIVRAPQTVVPGAAMPRVAMPASTLDAVLRFLTRNAPAASTPVAAAPLTSPAGSAGRASPASAAVLYAKWCASCHGPSGAGDGTNAAYLPVRPAVHSDARAMAARPDDALFDVIAAGGEVAGRSARMPGFGETLAASEIRSLVAYIRTLCGCRGPDWSRDGGLP